MSEVECPLDCGYVGEPSSVEAHISAKADDVHKGELGRFYEDELGEESVDEVAAVLEDDLEESGHEEMDVDEDVDDDLDREVAAGAAGAAVSAPFLLEEIDVDARVLLLGALALLTVLAFYLRRRGDGSDEEPEPAEEPAVDADGGLVA